MSTYSDQIRQLAQILMDNEEIPLVSVVITLNEAAQKIDELGALLQEARDELEQIAGANAQ